jgi:hypothetical protein
MLNRRAENNRFAGYTSAGWADSLAIDAAADQYNVAGVSGVGPALNCTKRLRATPIIGISSARSHVVGRSRRALH